MSEKNIESLLHETRTFDPPAEFARRAHVTSRKGYDELVARAAADREGFWAEIASELHWFKKWERVLDWTNPPFAKWFVGGQTNVSYNCLDRHVLAGRGDKVALLWEGEPGDKERITYAELLRRVQEFAGALRKMGVKAGDRVAVYMPMIPELPVALLACTRIGATHTVVFGGFSADALRDRIQDAQAKVVITADGGWRRGKPLALKEIVDKAVSACPSVEKVVVAERLGAKTLPVQWDAGRDVWWRDAIAGATPVRDAEPLDAEHPLFILYTSGTTGKPKGVLHTTGGYLVQAYITSKWVFDLRDDDVYWCTADVGWVTGH
ncbi:MAG TPA: AMP-binding protein, partial [Candidatus Binatia bacterium]|nr:AMP-binding protein [Candidatus Binatia bacterium]